VTASCSKVLRAAGAQGIQATYTGTEHAGERGGSTGRQQGGGSAHPLFLSRIGARVASGLGGRAGHAGTRGGRGIADAQRRRGKGG
jgi:hypothetical protein